LLVAKVDVDATTTADWTPLMLAYMNEHQDAVCALRRHGVDVTAKCVLGNTAADYARGENKDYVMTTIKRMRSRSSVLIKRSPQAQSQMLEEPCTNCPALPA
jgi:ankyrin repeat protein